MITIRKDSPALYVSKSYTVEELTERNYTSGKNAFIGNVEVSVTGLYIICFGCIFLVKNPAKSWSGSARVYVDRFVNLDVTIRERGE